MNLVEQALSKIDILMSRARHGTLGMNELQYQACVGRNLLVLSSAYDSGKVINLRYVQLGNNKLRITTPTEVYTYTLTDTFSYNTDLILALMVNQLMINLNKHFNKQPQTTGVIFDDAANSTTNSNSIRTNQYFYTELPIVPDAPKS